MATASSLVAQGFGGYAGWGDAEASADFAKTGGSGKQTGGGFGGGSSNAGVDAARAATDQIKQLLAQQKAEQEGLFNQFSDIRGGQEKLPSLYSRLVNESNIPQLSGQLDAARGAVFQTKDLLDRLEEDVNTRTSGSFTNDSQRRRQIAAEGDPLRTDLGRLLTGQELAATQLGDANNALGTRFSLETQQQAQELEPIKMKIAMFSDSAARELSGYTSAMSNELNAILAKIENDQQLSMAEQQRAHDLAVLEKTASNTANQIRQQMEADIEKSFKVKSTTTGTGSDAYLQALLGQQTAANTAATTANNAQSTWDSYKAPASSSAGSDPVGNWWNGVTSSTSDYTQSKIPFSKWASSLFGQ